MTELPAIFVTLEDARRLRQAIDRALTGGRYRSVAFLANELSRAVTVGQEHIPPGCMTMHATGRYLDERSGVVDECTLVYPGHQRPSFKLVSVMSEIGAALLGLSEGQRMAWHSPRLGPRSVRLIEVLHQPQRAAAARPAGNSTAA